ADERKGAPYEDEDDRRYAQPLTDFRTEQAHKASEQRIEEHVRGGNRLQSLPPAALHPLREPSIIHRAAEIRPMHARLPITRSQKNQRYQHATSARAGRSGGPA